MSTSTFLLRRADTILRHEDDPIRSHWWIGYRRGLRRAQHGDRFGSAEEHERWLSAATSDDPARAALGRGYRAGLTADGDEPI